MRLVLTAILFALLVPSAQAHPKVPEPTPPVLGNPAEQLRLLPIEASVYEPATRCDNRGRAGVTALTAWLHANVRGAFWGSYRCERWGKRSASLHAENRAIDWQLDTRVPADRRAADKLFRLLLAPDSLGNPQALARRMGVEELIWDCGYWGAGMSNFRPYSTCLRRNGRPDRSVDRTAAHRDHVHIGMTRTGANGRTSFWSAR